MRSSQLKHILDSLRSNGYPEFTSYKLGMLNRRIARQMALEGFKTPEAYWKHLRKNKAARAALSKDLLIHVTRFFRDPESFCFLEEKILPNLVRQHPKGQPLRIWVNACSTGEEVYSIAISALETMGKKADKNSVQIFATDADEASIRTARMGIYPESIRAEIPAKRLSRYFVKVKTGYRVVPSLRELCVFALQDMTRDPPFARIDLISCRNLLIYLDVPLQKRILQTFHFALNPHGILVLGESETTHAFRENFTACHRRHKFFAKKPVSMKVSPVWRMDASDKKLDQLRELLAKDTPPLPPAMAKTKGHPSPTKVSALREDLAATRENLRAVIEEQMASSEELNAAFEESQANNEELDALSKELKTSADDLRLANQDLQAKNDEIQNLVNTAPVIILILDPLGRVVFYNPFMEKVSGWRLEESKGKDWFNMFLLGRDYDRIRQVFKKAVADIQTKGNVNPILTKDGREIWIEWCNSTLKDSDGKIIGVLTIGQDITERKRAEEALREIQKQLQFVTDHAPVSIAQCDHEQRYKFVNHSYAEMFGLRPVDIIGKHPRDILGEEAYAQASPYMEAVLAGKPTEYDLVLPATPGGLRTVHVAYAPERDASGRFVGFITAISDITERKKAEEALQESEQRYREVFDGTPDGIIVHDANGIILDANDVTARNLETARAALIGRRLAEFVTAANAAAIGAHAASVLSGKALVFETTYISASGKPIPAEVHEHRIQWKGGQAVLSSARDITERKKANEALRESEEKFRSLFESSRDALMTLEPPSWAFTSGNPAAVEMFRAKSVAEFVSHTPVDLSAEQQPDGRASAEKSQEMINKARRDGSHV
ncbi:MAG: PAS domain S-box protein, partial [Lentisphaerota bacterium]